MEAPRTHLRILEISGQYYLGIRVASGKGIQSFIRLASPQDRKGWLLTEKGGGRMGHPGLFRSGWESVSVRPAFRVIAGTFH